jgi:bacterioferritin
MDPKDLIAPLNEDLAGELSAIIQYLTYAAKVTGPYRPQLSAFFLQEVADEQLHAQFLANKIVALGGEPTTTPRPVAAARTSREMLEAVLEAERRAIADYTERARQADEAGDKGLAVQLEDIVREESSHAEETERILRDWGPRAPAAARARKVASRPAAARQTAKAPLRRR